VLALLAERAAAEQGPVIAMGPADKPTCVICDKDL